MVFVNQRGKAASASLGNQFRGSLDQRCGAAVGLQMSWLSAGAHPRGGIAVDDDVAALAAAAILAVNRQVADDDPTADARSKRQQHDAMKLPAAPHPKLAVRGRIRV